jgi:hypothetical protein
MSKFLGKLTILSLPLLVGSCGGVSLDAKVANAIQVVLASAIEAFATTTPGSGGITVLGKCGKGDGTEGTFTFSTPSGLDDPFTLVQYITDNGSTAPLPLSFTNCIIRVCGDTVTLDGTAAAVVLNTSDLVGQVQSGEVPAQFTIDLNGIAATGFITGTLDFAYTLNAVFDDEALSDLDIEDATPAAPFVHEGKTYDAANVLTIADGC